MKHLGRCLMNSIRLCEGGRGSCLNKMPKKQVRIFSSGRKIAQMKTNDKYRELNSTTLSYFKMDIAMFAYVNLLVIW